MKIIVTLLKKIIFSLAVLYGFNVIMEALNLFIPLNLFTIGSVAILGFPGLFILVGLITVV